MEKRVSKSAWTALILFGFIGQIAWAIENMEFNIFLFNEIGGTSNDIARMVAWSAIVSTVATLAMGIISDRLRQKRIPLLGIHMLGDFNGSLFFAFTFQYGTFMALLDIHRSVDENSRPGYFNGLLYEFLWIHGQRCGL